MSVLASDIYYDEFVNREGWQPRKPSGTAWQDDKDRLSTLFKSKLGVSRPIRATDKYIKAKKPIKIVVKKEDDIFVAKNETLHIYATGSDINEAVQDFFHQLVYFYEHYRSLSKEQVTGDAVRLKEIYDSEFE